MTTALLVVYVLGWIVWALAQYAATARSARIANGGDPGGAYARHIAIVAMFSATIWPVWIVTETAIRGVTLGGRWVARITR